LSSNSIPLSFSEFSTKVNDTEIFVPIFQCSENEDANITVYDEFGTLVNWTLHKVVQQGNEITIELPVHTFQVVTQGVISYNITIDPTYHTENQQSLGGSIIGEIFTKHLKTGHYLLNVSMSSKSIKYHCFVNESTVIVATQFTATEVIANARIANITCVSGFLAESIGITLLYSATSPVPSLITIDGYLPSGTNELNVSFSGATFPEFEEWVNASTGSIDSMIITNERMYSATCVVGTSITLENNLVTGSITIRIEESQYLSNVYQNSLFASTLNWSKRELVVEDLVYSLLDNLNPDRQVVAEFRLGGSVEQITLDPNNYTQLYIPVGADYREYDPVEGVYRTSWQPVGIYLPFGVAPEEMPDEVSLPDFTIWAFWVMVIVIGGLAISGVVVLSRRGYAQSRVRGEMYGRSTGYIAGGKAAMKAGVKTLEDIISAELPNFRRQAEDYVMQDLEGCKAEKSRLVPGRCERLVEKVEQAFEKGFEKGAKNLLKNKLKN